MTMPRPSLVTSSGPSPVRGFIAAIIPSPSSQHRRPAQCNQAQCYQALHTSHLHGPRRNLSHNRFYPSPYYPVSGSRMVMIGHPGRGEYVHNGLSAGGSAIRRRVALEWALAWLGCLVGSS